MRRFERFATVVERDAQIREVKCVVNGITLEGSSAEAVVKIGFTGKLVVITVYLC